MKKTSLIVALALGLSIPNVNASNEIMPSNTFEVSNKVVKISPLCKAVATGEIELVKTYIRQGVDINKKSN